MYDYKKTWKEKITCAVNEILNEAGTNEKIDETQITAEIPPNREMGDLGFPMFSFAKILKKGPPQIAQILSERLNKSLNCDEKSKIEVQGPYLNIKMDRRQTAKEIMEMFFSYKNDVSESFSFGKPGTLKGQKVMVEFSSPNTNKPLHLGHLRNDVLGESVSRIIKACEAEVRKVCIINDRGIHICKSMLAYKEQGKNTTPESENLKSDHFVGKWYVCFSKELKKEAEELIKNGVQKEEAENQAQMMKKAQEMLRGWEAGDSEIRELWKKMNCWAIEGMKKTYKRTGISFDKFDFESETYMLGKDEVLKGLEKGIFFRQEDGAVAVDLTDEKLDKKILLRSDGTSIYITQDFGTAISRHKEWQFDKLIYVVGSEQQYHFKVLFILLEKLGFDWAKNLHHLSYGMVNLPEGKMKSREGTVVDADDLIDSLRDMALDEIKEKGREEDVGDPSEVAEKIALGALHYFLLQPNPVKDMLFDPKESLSFTGNTGPYLQYMGARISSMLRKSKEIENNSAIDFSLLISDPEWELLKILAEYPFAVSEAAASLDPSHLTGFLYELSKSFSRFYHECPILSCEDKALSKVRLELSHAVMMVLKDAFHLVCIPFLEVM
ncbi:MAG: arginine--tRNA ligase [Treponema sp.]|nr:arginine--tRNA ligase [Treponema sp.]MCL2251524.1 arginine--tRNA ligase [Treponema sp.]